MHKNNYKRLKTSRNGLEVAKAGQIADRWSIGSMVDGLMVDRSNSERLRGFCDRLTDGQTDRWTFAMRIHLTGLMDFVTNHSEMLPWEWTWMCSIILPLNCAQLLGTTLLCIAILDIEFITRILMLQMETSNSNYFFLSLSVMPLAKQH